MHMNLHNTTTTSTNKSTLMLTSLEHIYYCVGVLTFRNTPTTARPSDLLAASPKLGYLVFQCTRWSWETEGQKAPVTRLFTKHRPGFFGLQGTFVLCSEPIRRVHAWGGTFTRRLQGCGGLGDFSLRLRICTRVN